MLTDKEIIKYVNDEIYGRFNSDRKIHFKHTSLSNKFLSKLKHHYTCTEMTEHFYDSEQDSEEKRMSFNNWIEPYFKGNWGMSQKYVNNVAIDTLKNVKKLNVSKKQRFWIGYHGDTIEIYIFGRDIAYCDYCDYWFVYVRNGEV